MQLHGWIHVADNHYFTFSRGAIDLPSVHCLCLAILDILCMHSLNLCVCAYIWVNEIHSQLQIASNIERLM
jgi:hypothetical protein